MQSLCDVFAFSFLIVSSNRFLFCEAQSFAIVDNKFLSQIEDFDVV